MKKMKMFARFLSVAVAAGVVLASAVAAQAVTIETVPVGDVGNDGEPAGVRQGKERICGAVAYEFNIGKYEVTIAQYVEFLNAVAASDPHGLYNTGMDSGQGGGITRSGSDGSYTYAVKTHANDGAVPGSVWANKPVNNVSWSDALRFCNWLHNGQGSGSTETGAYTMASIDPESTVNPRNANATWWLASEDESYKAAFYKGGGTSAGYWTYATQSDTVPTVASANNVGDISNPGDNVANYNRGADWDGQNGNVTTVGSAGAGSASYYGAYDMTGNVWEWTEGLIDSSRIQRASGWYDGLSFYALESDTRASYPWYMEFNDVGFRVASVPPPPGTMIMVK